MYVCILCTCVHITEKLSPLRKGRRQKLDSSQYQALAVSILESVYTSTVLGMNRWLTMETLCVCVYCKFALLECGSLICKSSSLLSHVVFAGVFSATTNACSTRSNYNPDHWWFVLVPYISQSVTLRHCMQC